MVHDARVIPRAALLLLIASLSPGCAATREPHAGPSPARRAGLDAASSAQLDKLVKDVCSKSVVMLGEEPHHGSGRTLEIKAELVRRLIDRCGFDAVYFESGGYEFHDLNRRLASRTSAPEQVADAIGGLWSISEALDPLVDFLYSRASAGRIRLAGLDAQIGSATAGYERRSLAHDLSEEIREPRRSECAGVLSQPAGDQADRESEAACFGEAADALPPDADLSVLARATQVLLLNPPAGGGWDARERQMANMFRWHQRHATGASRAIVWTANVHACRQSEAKKDTVRPLGDELHAEYGDRLASIGFTAFGGAYGRGDSIPIPAAGSDSLEALALAGGRATLRYLPNAVLAELGEVEGSPFSYDKARRADWSKLFDGMVVLREEKPLARDRAAKPRFNP